MLNINTKAPDFTLSDQNEKEVSLHDFAGKKVVLYFYSKDSTSGCTRQGCAYNSLIDDFHAKGAVVIGISKDTAASHQRFAEKQGFRFTLLADPEKKVLQAYDVLKEKTMYGKKVMGTVRSSYLIDENGMIVEVRANVKPDDNAKEMLELL